MKTNYLVFSDLDGTLLDHNSYSFAPANEALAFLKSNSIPLILTTSKTFDEVVKLQKELSIHEPFIVENGAGIFIPAECVLAKGLAYKEDWLKVSHAKAYIELRLFFNDAKREFAIRGFGDMEVAEVMQLTGLDEESALNAMKRDFSEPFLFEDERELASFKKKANEEGLDVVKGGRFFHLVSLGQDKAHAMLCLTHMYDEYHSYTHRKIALGDSANDFTMIKEAEVGVLIPHHSGSYAPLKADGITLAKYPGPQGFNAAIKEIFNVK